MAKWSQQIEEELILLLKDWLKQKGRAQADLAQSLRVNSTRMPSIIEELKKDFLHGGIPKIANRLCEIEFLWSKDTNLIKPKETASNPLEQLDLLLEEINEDCEN